MTTSIEFRMMRIPPENVRQSKTLTFSGGIEMKHWAKMLMVSYLTYLF